MAAPATVPQERRIELEYRPVRWQLEAHNRMRRFSVIVAHRRAGKTVLALNTLIAAALRTRKQAARFWYLAPYRVQAKRVAWDYLLRYSAPIPGRKVMESELTIGFANGARIALQGADNADALRGTYIDGIVLDEVAQMRPNVWGAIIRPQLADRRGWALFIGTPQGINLFSELYHKAVEDPDWYAGMFRIDDTGMIDEEELEIARRTMTESQFRQEFLCDFTASTDNTLIPIDVAMEASRRSYAETEYRHAPKLVGVDVARYGGDRSVICRRQGLACLGFEVFQGMDNMTLAGQVARVLEEWKADACFVDAGRGEGVVDRLRQLGFDVVEVPFGARPSDDRYADKRSEMWDGMATWLEQGGAIPGETQLIEELCAPTYTWTAAGKFQLERKEELKKRGLRSPDMADALALTFAFPVAPKWRDPREGPRVRVEYDPFAMEE